MEQQAEGRDEAIVVVICPDGSSRVDYADTRSRTPAAGMESCRYYAYELAPSGGGAERGHINAYADALARRMTSTASGARATLRGEVVVARKDHRSMWPRECQAVMYCVRRLCDAFDQSRADGWLCETGERYKSALDEMDDELWQVKEFERWNKEMARCMSC